MPLFNFQNIFSQYEKYVTFSRCDSYFPFAYTSSLLPFSALLCPPGGQSTLDSLGRALSPAALPWVRSLGSAGRRSEDGKGEKSEDFSLLPSCCTWYVTGAVSLPFTASPHLQLSMNSRDTKSSHRWDFLCCWSPSTSPSVDCSLSPTHISVISLSTSVTSVKLSR